MTRFRFCCKMLATVVLLVTLSGCWDYRGLNELDIVTGIAIDRVPGEDLYAMTFEIVDLSKDRSSATQSLLVQSQGTTIFESIRDAKRKMGSRLYFGNILLIIVSEEVARDVGMANTIDFFMRDAEPRETVSVAISQESTAHEVLKYRSSDNMIASFQIKQALEEDIELTASTLDVEMYEVYTTLKSPGKELVLPAIHLVDNEDTKNPELNGLAVFKDDLLINYLSPEEAKYYLLIINRLKGGVFSYIGDDMPGGGLAVEVFKNKTQSTFNIQEDNISFDIQFKTHVSLNEWDGPIETFHSQDLDLLQRIVGQRVAVESLRLIQRVQQEMGSDIFGFGNLIYQEDNAYWKTVEDKWNEHFVQMEFALIPDIELTNTVFIKQP